jgi:hypothetical protein
MFTAIYITNKSRKGKGTSLSPPTTMNKEAFSFRISLAFAKLWSYLVLSYKHGSCLSTSSFIAFFFLFRMNNCVKYHLP